MRLLGFKKCNLHRCLCYKQPFDPETWSLLLCPTCEAALAVWIGGEEGAEQAERDRFDKLDNALQQANALVGQGILAYGHRRHDEFEKEIDWLRAAAHNFDQLRSERKNFVLRSTGKRVTRKRSVQNLISTTHRIGPTQTLTKTLSAPDLKRSCLLDMQTPTIRDSAPLGPYKGHGWPDKVINALHSTGGHYVQLGGSLNAKTIGCFSLGLNSCTLKKMRTGS